MSFSQQKQSEKLHIIDRNTFDKIQLQLQQQQQRSSSSSSGRGSGSGTAGSGGFLLRIRNSKYKKTHPKSCVNGGSGLSCDLLQFLKPKMPKCSASERRRLNLLRRRVIDTPLRQQRGKRGKTRETGRRKHYSKLKKSILRYRQQKRLITQTQQTCLQLGEATAKLKELCLASTASSVESTERRTNQPTETPHSRRFRSYCDNCTTPQMAQLTEQLLRELDRFQRRAYAQNEIKARAHRRFVVGFREMQNYLRINKVKLVIIAPDCEECSGEGLDETINAVKRQCQSQHVPYLFSLRRRQLAYALYKKVAISCIAILDYDGARDIFAQLLLALEEARHAYTLLLQKTSTSTPPIAAEGAVVVTREML